MKHLIVEGDSVYEIDERCMKEKEKREKEQQNRASTRKNMSLPPKGRILEKIKKETKGELDAEK